MQPLASPVADSLASLVLATRNPHKVAEFRRLLAPWGVAVEPLVAHVRLPPEDGDTFAANAAPKALTAAQATGRPAIADDSGIEARALGGGPGVRSARYAGPNASDEDNLAKFEREVPVGDALRYVCALAYVDPVTGAQPKLFFGDCRGTRAPARRGARGFGYDPVFVPDEDAQRRTMAQLADDEKDRISHRGRAARAFMQWLRQGP